MNRGAVLTLSVLATSALIVVGLAIPQTPPPPPFTIVVLPDTQYYANPLNGGLPAMFTSQTQWIVNNRAARNIVFVLHEGDITDSNDAAGWNNAKASMDLLDGVVPYALAVGNHDGLDTGSQNTALFNQYFPLGKFQVLPSFGGVFEPGKMENCYHYLTAGGVNWLILALEFGPRDVVLNWADQVVASHPLHRVIVVSHTHMYYDDTLHGSSPTHGGTPQSYGRQNNGDDVWNKFVKKHGNVMFFFNGHVTGDGQGRWVGTGDKGNSVYQMLCNYQSSGSGGNGFLRIIEFIPAQDRISATSYSPYVDQFKTDAQNQFEYTNLGLWTDTDGDGIPDSWEIQFGLDPNVAADAAADLDGDGSTNLQEFQAGTDLSDPTSVPPAGAPAGGSRGTGCGACGLEIVFLLGILSVIRRRSPLGIRQPGARFER